MKKRGRPRKTTRSARAQEIPFKDLRLRYIDRLVAAIDAYPGPPPGSEVARTAVKLRSELLTWRDGFIAGLNLARVS